MSDFERLLRSSLQQVGEGYEPTDRYAARERFLQRKRRRRRRFVASGVAVTAALVAVAVFASPLAVDDPPEPVLARPQPVATVPVGDVPTAVVTGEDDNVWVTQAEARSVMRIDPTSNEVIETVAMEGEPEEIVQAHGSVWVADDTGTVTRVGLPSDPTATRAFALVGRPETVHLDLAATDLGVVAVDPMGGMVYSLTVTGDGRVDREESLAFPATDVAFGPEGTWLLDGPEGELTNGDKIYTVPGGFNADLAVGAGRIWVSSGTDGGLYGVDPDSGEILVGLEIGGRYTDIAVDDNSVWALTGGDGPSQLRQIDARTGDVLGEPLQMDGDPQDVTISDGSAWVADGAGAEIVRIQPVREDAVPSPAPTGSTTEGRLDPDEMRFVYSADGDLFAQTSEDVVRLTDTPEAEIHPSISPDRRHIAFERGSEEANDRTVGILDLETGEECCFREGAWPTFGPHNQLAWVVPSHGLIEEDEQAMIAIGPMEGPPVTQVAAAPPDVGVLFSVQNLAWEQTGETLLYEAGYEGFSVHELDVITGPDGLVERAAEPVRVPVEGAESGAVYTALSSAHEFNVVRACCLLTEGDAYDETVEFGELTAEAEQDYPYRRLFDLSRLGMRVEERALFSSYAGTLVAEETDDDVVFRDGDESSWLIGDGVRLWLTTGSGESTQMPYEVHGGASAPPPFFD